MAKRKKKTRKRPYRPKKIPYKLNAAIDEADALMEEGEFLQAREILEAIVQKYPNHPDGWAALAELFQNMNDWKNLARACEQFAQVTRQDAPIAYQTLAGAYALNAAPALALQTIRQVQERWPDYEPELVEEMVSDFTNILREIVPQLDLPESESYSFEDRVAIAALNDKSRLLTERGDLAEGRAVAQELLEKVPGFIPAYNNIGLTHFLEGNLSEALQMAEQALSRDPDNYHALANATRYAFYLGRDAEVQQYAARLKQIKSNEDLDLWVKQAEAFTYLGDDAAVLETFAQAEKADQLEYVNSFLYHLAAVANYRQGNEKLAQNQWREAVKRNPAFVWAQRNLADLKRPVGERHAPFAFGLNNWIGKFYVEELSDRLHEAEKKQDDRATQKATRQFLDAYPEITRIAPQILDLGDADARQFILHLTEMAETPELLEAFVRFALGRRGPDAMRHKALQIIREADPALLPEGAIPMWVKGQQTETMLLNFEIYDEPEEVEYPPGVHDLLAEAIGELNYGEAANAVDLLEQAVELAPNEPTVLNNLAAAYGQAGRKEESQALIRRIRAEFPDYFFGRTNWAMELARDGKVDEAGELLKPLMKEERLHYSEFFALAQAQIELLLATGETEGARVWLQMMEDVDDEHPHLPYWHQRLNPLGTLRQRLGKLFSRSKG